MFATKLVENVTNYFTRQMYTLAYQTNYLPIEN